MYRSLILMAFVFMSGLTSGQPTVINDSAFNTSVTLKNFYDSKGSKKWISIDNNITIITSKLQLTPIEIEISKAESLECSALLRRDTTAIKEIWLRDFTLDEPQTELHLGKNSIPYYIGIHRSIERITMLNDVVYVTGYENTGRLKGDGKVEAPIIRKFNHVWTKQAFNWRLASKYYEE